MKIRYSRVDFNNLQSIINYGHEVQDKLVKISDELTSSIESDEQTSLDEHLLEKIVYFNDTVNTSNSKKFLPVKFLNKNLLIKINSF